MSAAMSDDLPAQVLEEAIDWTVRLKSGTARPSEIAACEAWRHAAADHEHVWQRLQALEQEFERAPKGPATLMRETLERARTRARNSGIKLLSLVAVGLCLSWLVSGHHDLRHWQADYVTASGEQRTVILADGSELRLNTATAVAVDFTDQQRIIELLAGEIFISTGKDAGTNTPRPLIVRTQQARLRPIGTRFLVRQEPTHTRLHVVDGAVAITPNTTRGNDSIARAGQTFHINDLRAEQVTDQPLDAGAWLDGALSVKQMRLADFLDELGRYHTGWLRCDPAVAELRISGVFQLDDTHRALRALEETLPVKVESFTGYWITVTAR